MPATAGTTSDLYIDADNPSATLGQPPAPPVTPPAPPRVIETVNVKHRMADEDKNGNIRDTSTDALKPSNDLGFRNVDDEAQAAKQAAKTAPPEAPPEPAKEAVVETPKQEKLYAGKFKSEAELEEGYKQAERAMHAAMEKAATLERAQQAVPPPPPAPKTPEQLASEQAEANRIINEFVQNPKAFTDKLKEEAIAQTKVALTSQAVAEQWRKENADIAAHEIRVAFEATLLAQSDPELAKNPAALINKATEQFRSFAGKLRTEGAKEALTQETRVIPLVSSTAPSTATEQPGKAPMTADDAYAAHMRMLKVEEQRSHRGLRR